MIERLAMKSRIKQVEASNIVVVDGTEQSTQKRSQSAKKSNKFYDVGSLFSEFNSDRTSSSCPEKQE